MENKSEVEQNEKRARFDTAPTANITGNELFEWTEPLDMRKIRAKVIPWLDAQGYFRSDYVNDDTGWSGIAITQNGIINSLAHGSGPEKIQAFAALPEMMKHGVFIRTRPSRKDGQRDMKSHIFATKINIGDRAKLVGFVIKEDSNGRRFYDHELTEIKNLDGLTPQAGAAGLDTGKADRTRQGSIINIIREALKCQ